jgi:hypothetical protein
VEAFHLRKHCGRMVLSVLRMQRIGSIVFFTQRKPTGGQVARADIRIRIRGRIVRVHVSEPVIRAIIRVTANIRASP